MALLHYFGRRRPASLADQGDYREADAKNRLSSPQGQQVPKDVKGIPLKGRKTK